MSVPGLCLFNRTELMPSNELGVSACRTNEVSDGCLRRIDSRDCEGVCLARSDEGVLAEPVDREGGQDGEEMLICNKRDAAEPNFRFWVASTI